MKVLLFGSQPLVNASVQELIVASDPTVRSMGCCHLSEASRCLSTLAPDVAIMIDPTSEGWEAAVESIRYRTPRQKIALVLGQALPAVVKYALEVGVKGLFSVETTAEEFVEGLRRIEAGRSYVATQFTAMVPAMPDDSKATPRTTLLLTTRERQVLLGIAAGRTSQGIATMLGVSVHMVDSHRRNIMEKLGLHNVAAVVRFASELSRSALSPETTADGAC